MNLRKILSISLTSTLLCQVAFAHKPAISVWDERRPAAVQPVLPSFSDFTQFGSIRRTLTPSKTSSRPTIIHIQDIHQNGEAQSNIGKAIAALSRAGNLRTIALEGAFDRIDLGRFHAFSDRSALIKSADYFLRENKISGALHAALLSADNIRIIGIDDRGHYDANVNAVQQTASLAEASKVELAKQRQRMEAAKATVFGEKLTAFDREVENYHAGRTTAGAYAKFLFAYSRGRDLRHFIEAYEFEKSLSVPFIESERRRLLNALVPKLTPSETDTLKKMGNAFGEGKLTHADFYSALNSLCEAKHLSLSRDYPALFGYFKYVLLANSIDGSHLFEQIREAERNAFASLASNEFQRKLIAKARRLYLSERLTSLAMTPDEWREYSAGLQPGTPFERFYSEAVIRDRRMAEKVLAEMHGLPAGATVALVTGGFHADGIDRALSDAGYRVVQFVPTVTNINTSDASAYLSVFLQQKSPLDKLFAGQKLFLAAPQEESLPSVAVGAALSGANPAALLHELIPDADLTITSESETGRGAMIRFLKKGAVIAADVLFTASGIKRILFREGLNLKSKNWAAEVAAPSLVESLIHWVPFFPLLHKENSIHQIGGRLYLEVHESHQWMIGKIIADRFPEFAPVSGENLVYEKRELGEPPATLTRQRTLEIWRARGYTDRQIQLGIAWWYEFFHTLNPFFVRDHVNKTWGQFLIRLSGHIVMIAGMAAILYFDFSFRGAAFAVSWNMAIHFLHNLFFPNSALTAESDPFQNHREKVSQAIALWGLNDPEKAVRLFFDTLKRSHVMTHGKSLTMVILNGHPTIYAFSRDGNGIIGALGFSASETFDDPVAQALRLSIQGWQSIIDEKLNRPSIETQFAAARTIAHIPDLLTVWEEGTTLTYSSTLEPLRSIGLQALWSNTPPVFIEVNIDVVLPLLRQFRAEPDPIEEADEEKEAPEEPELAPLLSRRDSKPDWGIVAHPKFRMATGDSIEGEDSLIFALFNRIHRFNLRTGLLTTVLIDPPFNTTNRFILTACGNVLLSIANNSEMAVGVDTHTGRQLFQRPYPWSGPDNANMISADGRYYLYYGKLIDNAEFSASQYSRWGLPGESFDGAGNRRTLHESNSAIVWDLELNREIFRMPLAEHLHRVIISPDGNTLYALNINYLQMGDHRIGREDIIEYKLYSSPITPDREYDPERMSVHDLGTGRHTNNTAVSSDGRLFAIEFDHVDKEGRSSGNQIDVYDRLHGRVATIRSKVKAGAKRIFFADDNRFLVAINETSTYLYKVPDEYVADSSALTRQRTLEVWRARGYSDRQIQLGIAWWYEFFHTLNPFFVRGHANKTWGQFFIRLGGHALMIGGMAAILYFDFSLRGAVLAVLWNFLIHFLHNFLFPNAALANGNGKIHPIKFPKNMDWAGYTVTTAETFEVPDQHIEGFARHLDRLRRLIVMLEAEPAAEREKVYRHQLKRLAMRHYPGIYHDHQGHDFRYYFTIDPAKKLIVLLSFTHKSKTTLKEHGKNASDPAFFGWLNRVKEKPAYSDETAVNEFSAKMYTDEAEPEIKVNPLIERITGLNLEDLIERFNKRLFEPIMAHATVKTINLDLFVFRNGDGSFWDGRALFSMPEFVKSYDTHPVHDDEFSGEDMRIFFETFRTKLDAAINHIYELIHTEFKLAEPDFKSLGTLYAQTGNMWPGVRHEIEVSFHTWRLDYRRRSGEARIAYEFFKKGALAGGAQEEEIFPYIETENWNYLAPSPRKPKTVQPLPPEPEPARPPARVRTWQVFSRRTIEPVKPMGRQELSVEMERVWKKQKGRVQSRKKTMSGDNGDIQRAAVLFLGNLVNPKLTEDGKEFLRLKIEAGNATAVVLLELNFGFTVPTPKEVRAPKPKKKKPERVRKEKPQAPSYWTWTQKSWFIENLADPFMAEMIFLIAGLFVGGINGVIVARFAFLIFHYTPFLRTGPPMEQLSRKKRWLGMFLFPSLIAFLPLILIVFPALLSFMPVHPRIFDLKFFQNAGEFGVRLFVVLPLFHIAMNWLVTLINWRLKNRGSALHFWKGNYLSAQQPKRPPTHHLPAYLWKPFKDQLRGNDMGYLYERVVTNDMGVARLDENGEIQIETALLPLLTRILNEHRTNGASDLTEKDVRAYLVYHENVHVFLQDHPDIVFDFLTSLRKDAAYETVKTGFANNYGDQYLDDLRFAEELVVVFITERRLLKQPVRLVPNPDKPTERTELPPSINRLLMGVGASVPKKPTIKKERISPPWREMVRNAGGQWPRIKVQLAPEPGLQMTYFRNQADMRLFFRDFLEWFLSTKNPPSPEHLGALLMSVFKEAHQLAALGRGRARNYLGDFPPYSNKAWTEFRNRESMFEISYVATKIDTTAIQLIKEIRRRAVKAGIWRDPYINALSAVATPTRKSPKTIALPLGGHFNLSGEWEHTYPDISNLSDRFLRLAGILLAYREAWNRPDTKLSDAVLLAIEFQRFAQCMSFWTQINNSIYMGLLNEFLLTLQLQGLEHGLLDLEAMGMEKLNYAKLALLEVAKANPGVDLDREISRRPVSLGLDQLSDRPVEQQRPVPPDVPHPVSGDLERRARGPRASRKAA